MTLVLFRTFKNCVDNFMFKLELDLWDNIDILILLPYIDDLVVERGCWWMDLCWPKSQTLTIRGSFTHFPSAQNLSSARHFHCGNHFHGFSLEKAMCGWDNKDCICDWTQLISFCKLLRFLWERVEIYSSYANPR